MLLQTKTRQCLACYPPEIDEVNRPLGEWYTMKWADPWVSDIQWSEPVKQEIFEDITFVFFFATNFSKIYFYMSCNSCTGNEWCIGNEEIFSGSAHKKLGDHRNILSYCLYAIGKRERIIYNWENHCVLPISNRRRSCYRGAVKYPSYLSIALVP